MKKLIKNIGRFVGIEIGRYSPITSSNAKLERLISACHIDLVIDVGANKGQFALEIRERGYRGKIFSVEPLSDAYDLLLRQAEDDHDWVIAPRAAVGSEDGEIEINISGNSVSSSILPMLKSHSDAAPKSNYVAMEYTPLYRLDTLSKDCCEAAESVFLKIDTQGYEKQVLEGAVDTLQKVKIMQIELSLVPLYDGQVLMCDMINQLQKLGFEVFNLAPFFFDPESGKLLQVDGLFARKFQ